jgi:hypothetical protein
MPCTIMAAPATSRTSPTARSDRCRESRNGRNADVCAGASRRARGGNAEHREANVPQHEAHETPQQGGSEAPEPDEDEDESVQALEYPV